MAEPKPALLFSVVPEGYKFEANGKVRVYAPAEAFDPDIGFEQIIALIESSKLIQVLDHPNAEKYPNQLLYEVDVDGYVHVVPVVREGRILFMKTIYPSRKATRKREKGEPA